MINRGSPGMETPPAAAAAADAELPADEAAAAAAAALPPEAAEAAAEACGAPAHHSHPSAPSRIGGVDESPAWCALTG